MSMLDSISSIKDENTKKADCIRNRSNFSVVQSFHMVDKKDYDPEMLNKYIEHDASPKLKLLMKKIQKLDEQDMKKSGKLFKHLIFTDVNNSAYGAKIIASTLVANNMNMIIHPQGKGFAIYPNEKLLETKDNNFAVLLSKSFYERPMNIKIRKNILDLFNRRPDNVYGELVRFIILDQGFKEGIDLFDVKYVHLFEPSIVKADEKQAIGRATRFCGQKGLDFHPKYGWPLYVFKYDVEIPETHHSRYSDTKKLFDLYLKYSNIDMRKVVFASELEKASIDGAVDADLTRTIHTFSIEKPDEILKDTPMNSPMKMSGGQQSRSPRKIMNKQDMKKHIQRYFMRSRYPRVTLQNGCMSGGASIVEFTPTQDFVRKYFQPESAYKGLLLYHSVGTGKTCTAIATATTSFDLQDYTILWVTRHTLKSDIWKNMFNQVCNIQIQKDLQDGIELPKVIRGNLKHVSKNWLEPISYKQFSNMLLKKNKTYNEMVSRNGSADPLRKTLLIIDEAHKLYSENVAKSEKPNTDILEKMIQKSYDVSGKDSVRVLMMTATPFTEDGMEMIKLLNLLKEKEHLPTEFPTFAEEFLDDNGYFTKKGLKTFQDKISGYISYLNRSQDARNFALPVIQNVYSKMSIENKKTIDVEEKIKNIKLEIKDLKASIKTDDTNIDMKNELETKMAELNEYKKQLPKNLYDTSIEETKEELKEFKEKAKMKTNTLKENKRNAKDCVKNVKGKYKGMEESAKNDKKTRTSECQKLDVKSRKVCKQNVMDDFNTYYQSLQIKKGDELKECNDFMDIEGDDDDVKKSIVEVKSKIEEIKEKKRGAKKATKETNNKSKELRYKIQDLNTEMKQISNKLQMIKSIKDKVERDRQLKEFKKSKDNEKIKEVKKEIKELRVKIRKNNLIVKSEKLTDGRLKLNKISQEYALNKYCNIR